jgi:hypothetical protein
MVTLNAHFDGKVIVPDEPLNLPANQKVRISVEPIGAAASNGKRVFGQQKGAVLYIAPDFDDYLGDEFWGLSDEKQT